MRGRLVVVMALVLGACGAVGEEAVVVGPEPVADDPVEFEEGPPPVVVRGDGSSLSLAPVSYCWSGPDSGLCVDGVAPRPLPEVGSPDELVVEFPVQGWSFQASAVPVGEPCASTQSVDLEATGPTTHRLVPIGAAGDYEISLFGRGDAGAEQSGDLSVSFLWNTPRDGLRIEPTASATIVANAPPLDLGPELTLIGLAETPEEISARATVSAGNGQSVAFDLEPQGDTCAGRGAVNFEGPSDAVVEANQLGAGPLAYRIDLVIDGTAYRGSGTWPDDVDPECSPCTRIRFDPPLPG